MPSPSVTYTFINGTSSDGPQVSQNFSDLIAAMTDGTKDFGINALTVSGALTANGAVTVSGALTANGAVTLGNAAADVLTFTGTGVSLTLNNGATDGGAVYFDGVATSFLKSSADGLTLTIGGFTKINPNTDDSVLLGDTTHRFRQLSLSRNIGTTTPSGNTLYADLISKAWARTTSGGTIQSSVNLTVVHTSTGVYTYSFRNNFGGGNDYVVTPSIQEFTTGYHNVSSQSSTGFVVRMHNSSNVLTDMEHGVTVVGMI